MIKGNIMDNKGIDGTNIHPNRWYRRSLSKTKFHRVYDIGGEAEGLIIYTRCGLSIRANDCNKQLVDWALKPTSKEMCKTCNSISHPIYFPLHDSALPRENVMATRPKVVYGAGVNLSGLWGPVKMKYHESDCVEGEFTYWDKEGDFDVEDIGLIEKDGHITFADPDKRTVETWVSGVKTTMKMLQKWCQ